MRAAWNVALVGAVVVGVMLVGTTPGGAKGEEPRADHRILRRETADGVTIRAAGGPLPDDRGVAACTGPGCMPEPCQPRGIAILGFSTAAAVGEGYLDVYRRPTSRAVLAGAGVFGVSLGEPVGWVALRTGPDAARVEARFGDGMTDSMRPVDDWVVLAAPIGATTGPEQYMPSATVRVEADDGSVLDTLTIDEQVQYAGPPEPCPTSTLETKLPKGTGRAPTDEEQARTEIVAAFTAAYGGVGSEGALDHVEDGASIAEVTRVATERYPQYAGTIRLTAEKIRFLDVDEAAVRLTLDVYDPGIRTTLARGVGRAVLRDGTWLVSRDTFCKLLALGAVYCPLPDGVDLD